MSEQRRDEEIQSNLRFIARALWRIETGEHLETELRNLRAFVLNCLELVRADDTLLQAADDLVRLASECVYEQEQDILLDEEPRVSPTRVRAAEEALYRFRVALADARLPGSGSISE